MGRHPVFIGEDGDGVHGEFMGSPEDTDGDLLEAG
jgi:hypothetical protein